MTRPKTPPPALEVKGLSYCYLKSWERALHRVGLRRPSSKRYQGLKDIYLTLHQAKIYGIMGSNGAGKSTLFKLLCGDLYPDAGEMILRGRTVTSMPRWRRARLGLGYISQYGGLVEDLSVELNLNLGAESGKRWGRPMNTPTSVQGALERLEITSLATQRVATLSGGERRRVELARILLQRPYLIILDEPFAALDHAGIDITIEILKQCRTQGASILLTDHQRPYLEQVCDDILNLQAGSLIAPLLNP